MRTCTDTYGHLAPFLAALLCVLLPLGSSCAPIDFEEPWEIQKLRVLAVTADPPEVGPEETVVVRAFAAAEDPQVTFSWRWEVCFFTDGPETSFACQRTGDEELDAWLDALGEGAEGAEFTLENPLGGEVLDALCDAAREQRAELCTIGLPVTLRATVTRNDTQESLVTTRRLVLLRSDVATRDDRNRNPALAELTFGETELDASVVAEVPHPELSEWVDLAFAFPDDIAQTYQDPITGEERTEDLRVSWFVSGGELERGRTYFRDGVTEGFEELQANRWRITSDRRMEEGETLRIWGVLRDNRGGKAILERSLRFVAP